jgi:hypothetical protein
MAAGTDVSETPVELGDGDLGGVVITFSDRAASIAGSVRNPQGGPDTDAAVIVFPADNQAWANYGLNPRRMRSARTTAKGSFTFGTMPPGEYSVIAISEEFAGEWQDPRYLEALARQAQRVTIAEGQQMTLELTRSNVRPPAGGLELARDAEHARRSSADHGPFVEDAIEPSPQVRDSRGVPAPVASPGTAGSISGTVLTDDGLNQPVRRARVVLTGDDPRNTRPTMTTMPAISRWRVCRPDATRWPSRSRRT